MNPKYERQLKKGVLELLVLCLLREEEKYGYQLLSELRDRGGGMFAMKEGTLYPILYRLEDDGLVISRWREPKGKEISRKYYALTRQGEETLADLRELWAAFEEQVTAILGEGSV